MSISLLEVFFSDGRYHQYRFRYDTDYFLVKVLRYRLPKRLLPPIFKIINVSRAGERLAAAPGQIFFRGPYLKNFSWKIFSGEQLPPQTSALQLLSRDFISFFYAKFRYLEKKPDILSFVRKYLTHKKDWGPTKIFRGPPAPRGPGQFAPPLPPSLRPWM
jgi:hypothetical protein